MRQNITRMLQHTPVDKLCTLLDTNVHGRIWRKPLLLLLVLLLLLLLLLRLVLLLPPLLILVIIIIIIIINPTRERKTMKAPCTVLYFLLCHFKIPQNVRGVLIYNKGFENKLVDPSPFMLYGYYEHCVKQHSETQITFPLTNVTKQREQPLLRIKESFNWWMKVLRLIWNPNIYHTDHKC
jgi:hypothetical protein